MRGPMMPFYLVVEREDDGGDWGPLPSNPAASVKVCCERKLHLGIRIGDFAVMGTIGPLPPCSVCSAPRLSVRPLQKRQVQFDTLSIVSQPSSEGYSEGPIDIGRRRSSLVQGKVSVSAMREFRCFATRTSSQAIAPEPESA